MSLSIKIANIKKDFTSLIKKLRGASLTDIWTVYKRFLKRVPDISHLKNIVLFSGIATLLILIFFAQRFSALYEYLPKKPAEGGIFTEGIVGNIEQVNPLFTSVNPAEESVVSLVFSGLTKRDGNRKTVPDLAESWIISEDGKIYTFKLRDNLLWEDGHKLTSADVSFTINTIQNPDVRSPLLEVWKNVEVETPDEKTVIFKLSSPYAAFLANTDFAIVPKHVLEMIPPRNLKIAEFNTKPVGNGPFKLEAIKTIKDSQEVTLTRNENYYGKTAYLDKIILKTYPNNTQLSDAYSKREILGIERVIATELEKKSKFPNLKIYETAVPGYDVLYFNLRKGFTKEKSIREALALAVDRKKITENVYNDFAVPVFTPILPGYIGHKKDLKQNPDLTAARTKLASAGFAVNNEGFLQKNNEKISLRLLTTNDDQKVRQADEIKAALNQLGIEVKIETYSMSALIQEHIRPRDFDLLLITQNLGSDPDLYAFWHSTQLNDPGLNFSGYSDPRLDKYLEQARVTSDVATRQAKYEEVTKLIWAEVPAIFTVRPSYVYGTSKEVKGIDIKKLVEPKDRFWNIEEWYILDKKAK